MKVYITYDRYEHNEWFSVYHISLDKEESIKHCKEVDLVNFLSYGPDDCHSFQLQEVEMTQEQYEQLLKWNKDDTQSLESYGDKSSDYYNFMYDLYNGQYETDTIISTDGCSDFYEIITYYGVFYKGEDVEDFNYDSDNFDDYQEELCNDEDLFEKVLKEYINDTY
jgi:hypothetical protein